MKRDPVLHKNTRVGPRSSTGSPSEPPSGIVFLISASMNSAAAGPRNSRSRSARRLHGRCQRDGRHLFRRPRTSDGSRPRRNRALGRRVERRDRAAHHRLARAEVDDPAAAGLSHDGVRGLVGKDSGLDIRVEEEVDILSGDLTGDAGLPQPGRMQQDVEPSERLGRAVDHVIDARRVAHVALQPRDAGAFGWRRPVIGRDNRRPRLAEHVNRGRADAGRAARNEYAPALQWLRHN